MKSARFSAATSMQVGYDDTVPWFERLCVDCPLTGECKRPATVGVQLLLAVLRAKAYRPVILCGDDVGVNPVQECSLRECQAPPLHMQLLLTGRDVSNGTFRIDAVRTAFVRSARKLEALARGRKISDNSLNYLNVGGGGGAGIVWGIGYLPRAQAFAAAWGSRAP